MVLSRPLEIVQAENTGLLSQWTICILLHFVFLLASTFFPLNFSIYLSSFSIALHSTQSVWLLQFISPLAAYLAHIGSRSHHFYLYLLTFFFSLSLILLALFLYGLLTLRILTSNTQLPNVFSFLLILQTATMLLVWKPL